MDSEFLALCAQSVERGDPERFLAVRVAPVAARDALVVLYAFNVEISRAPWLTKEPMIAQMRLQFWRDILEEIAQGKAVRPHEVATPLAGMLTAESAALLDQLIVSRHWDIQSDPFESMEDFTRYIEHTSGNLMLVAAQILGEADSETVVDYGYGVGVANWLRAVPALEAAGRMPLVDGRPEAVADLARGALQRLRRARKNRAKIALEARPALLSGWQAEAILRQAVADPQKVADGALELSEFSSKLRLLKVSVTGRW